MLHLAVSAITLSIFWLLLAGVYSPLVLSLGFVSISLTVFLIYRMNIVTYHTVPLHLSWNIPLYWYWLIKEIIKSNISVIKLIWTPKLSLQPTLLSKKTYLKTDLARVIYANSITLTPGSITISLNENGKLEIHTLMRETAEDLKNSSMENVIAKMGLDTPYQIHPPRSIKDAS